MSRLSWRKRRKRKTKAAEPVRRLSLQNWLKVYPFPIFPPFLCSYPIGSIKFTLEAEAHMEEGEQMEDEEDEGILSLSHFILA